MIAQIIPNATQVDDEDELAVDAEQLVDDAEVLSEKIQSLVNTFRYGDEEASISALEQIKTEINSFAIYLGVTADVLAQEEQLLVQCGLRRQVIPA